MDSLTKYLYTFVCGKRLENLFEDAEYQTAMSAVELWEERVSAYLNVEQHEELNRLIDAIACLNSIENEHIFQATLSLSRELNGLVSCFCQRPG